MNKEAIRNTVAISWSEEDDCYIASSPLMEGLIGVGDTDVEAIQEFSDLLDDAYEAYEEGRIKNTKPGRPSKGKIALNVDVEPDVKDFLKQMAYAFKCSQGEAIEILVAYYKAHAKRQAAPAATLEAIKPANRQVYLDENAISLISQRVADRLSVYGLSTPNHAGIMVRVVQPNAYPLVGGVEISEGILIGGQSSTFHDDMAKFTARMRGQDWKAKYTIVRTQSPSVDTP